MYVLFIKLKIIPMNKNPTKYVHASVVAAYGFYHAWGKT
jgi:hypothetical protein